jgi:hypothetical protein
MTANAEDVSAKLVALRQALEASVWSTATEAAVSGDHEKVRDLVRLKVDIEAIDFALSHRPVGAVSSGS